MQRFLGFWASGFWESSNFGNWDFSGLGLILGLFGVRGCGLRVWGHATNT